LYANEIQALTQIVLLLKETFTRYNVYCFVWCIAVIGH